MKSKIFAFCALALTTGACVFDTSSGIDGATEPTNGGGGSNGGSAGASNGSDIGGFQGTNGSTDSTTNGGSFSTSAGLTTDSGGTAGPSSTTGFGSSTTTGSAIGGGTGGTISGGTNTGANTTGTGGFTTGAMLDAGVGGTSGGRDAGATTGFTRDGGLRGTTGGGSTGFTTGTTTGSTSGTTTGSTGGTTTGTTGSDPLTAPSKCTSNQRWSGVNGATMRPGENCRNCHTFTIAGTVFPSGHEPNDCNGANGGITVVITDKNGKVTNIPINNVGNFDVSTSIATPFTAKIVDTKTGKERAMVSPQTEGGCNSCHTQNGMNGAPGRITVPF